MSASLIKLAALDAEDLQVLSAHVQDAIVTTGDIRLYRRPGVFAMVCRRFAWESAAGGEPERRLSSLELRRVHKMRTLGFSRRRPHDIHALLALTFIPGDNAPEGAVELTFSGGAGIRLEVECIEALLRDLGPRWSAGAEPRHDDTGEED